MKVKKNSKLFKELQNNDIFDEFGNYKMPNYFESIEINSAIPDYFCPPNHKMVKSTIVPNLKFVDMKACILRDIADKLVELADMLDSEVRQ